MSALLTSPNTIAPCFVALAAALAFGQPQRNQDTNFEGYAGVLLTNDKLQLTVLRMGSTIANLTLLDDRAKLSPLWNAPRLAREAGRQAQADGILGHFVCVDGFGPSSAEERAAGIPGHGEAHVTNFKVAEYTAGKSVSLTATLPIVEEVFTRTFRIINGENVIYVDSVLENLLGFDRPVNWAEHATVSAPFLESGKTKIFLSGTRSQNRDYLREQAMTQTTTGGGNVRAGRNDAQQQQRRLASGADFTWPMAKAIDGKPVDMSVIPEDPHFLDHATTLMDPSRQLEWVAAFNSEQRLLYGYVFRREDYWWLQHWGSYPGAKQVVRGMEFGTQPYDVPRRETITLNSMFGAPTYRWLPAKSKIESHFLLFYTRVPQGLNRVDDIRLENGRLIIEDQAAKKDLNLAASRGL